MQEGLTTTYNRFHNPNEDDPGIVRLRELHDGLDRAMLDAYGWTDFRPVPDFYLDYEEAEDEEDGGSSSRSRGKKKPWRYRWSDTDQDEVLERLWDLQLRRKAHETAQESAKATAETPTKPTKSRSKRDEPKDGPAQLELL